MLKTYDLIVVPGLKLTDEWQLHVALIDRLDRAIEIYKQHGGIKIAVCGRWSIHYDWQGVTPPVRECDVMKAYLTKNGVKSQDVFMETKSKDTVGNAYYLKVLLRNRPQYKRLIIICAEKHKQRVDFIFDKFFGEGFDLEYLAMPAPGFNQYISDSETKILKDQKKLLVDVRRGHERDFKHQLYNSSYYTSQTV